MSTNPQEMIDIHVARGAKYSRSTGPDGIDPLIGKRSIIQTSSLIELKNIINLELKNLVEWFRINKLSLNAAKSCYIIFSASNKNRGDSDININIDGNNMDQVISTKFLGI